MAMGSVPRRGRGAAQRQKSRFSTGLSASEGVQRQGEARPGREGSACRRAAHLLPISSFVCVVFGFDFHVGQEKFEVVWSAQ